MLVCSSERLQLAVAVPTTVYTTFCLSHCCKFQSFMIAKMKPTIYTNVSRSAYIYVYEGPPAHLPVVQYDRHPDPW